MNDKCLQDICEVRESLIALVKSVCANGPENVSTHELGAVIDMIKDLYEAEKDAAKVCYYETVVEAMEKTDTRVVESSDDVISSVRMMWNQAEPLTKKQMKADLTKLLNEMTV